MQGDNSGIYHLRVGDITVTALNDGMIEGSTEIIAGVSQAEAEAQLRSAFRRLPPRLTVNAFLLTIGGKHVLVDAGSGTAMGPEHGGMRRHLDALGIAPAAIGTILLTHAHIDHASGLIDDAGGAFFPNAELVVHEAETGFWLDAAKAAAAPEAMRDSFALAKRCLTPYGNRTRTVRDGTEALPGIVARHLPGHTPGHSGWLVSSGADALLIWGDVVHLPGLQFARPEAGMVFDNDVEQARGSRRRAFEMAASERMRVAGMHLDFPGFGYVARSGSGYVFVPEVWSASA